MVRLVNEIALAAAAEEHRSIRMTSSATATFTVAGVCLTPIMEGGARRDALLSLIAQAQNSLRLFYYIFAEDDVGTQVRDALCSAARRGVSVALTIDGFGSTASDAFLAPLVAAGANICRFLPRFGRRYLLRNHQKMALADEQRALIGGFNIADDYFADDDPLAWRDLGLLVEGDAVRQLSGYYDVLHRWSQRERAPIRELRQDLRRWSQPEGPVRWLMGGPVRRLNPWVRAVKKDLRTATRIDMISAYFVPNPAMLRRIEAVGRRGTANLMTAGRSDSDITIAAARYSYHGLLKNGVRVWEYRLARLHTKLLIIDDSVYVGSANLDMRSLFLNLEIMLRIEDAGFASEIRRFIDRNADESEQITLQVHRARRTPFRLIKGWLSYFLVGVLDYKVTRRLNFRL
jgi:cardiolipin synthase